ncbi:MAG: VTT domain-containing protein [Actinomycetota bacterium]|jgi:uncharacterized membrane protein YdjX (TVP38/TMEM64 family)|nr:VTT domain-containing protein [Actinomycetota bacterium]
MKRPLRNEWAARLWSGPVVVGLLALVALAVIGFFVVRAFGGSEQMAGLMEQLQTAGLRMRDWIEQSGPWAPLTYLVAKAATFIFLPWAGYPLNVASGALFGLFWGVILTALGDTLGGCILYGLSRWAGRPAVARILGESRMARVDRVVDTGLGGWRELLFFRVVVPIPYNLVSLAAGLAPTLTLRQYATVTFLTAAPKVFTVGIGAGLVTGEWMEVAVAGGLVVIAVAAMLTVRSVREALMRALRWRRREKRIEDGTEQGT